MAPLVLEGANLGKRHQYFNKLVNETIKNKVSFESIEVQEETTDIDKLFKIDIACQLKNVDYIIETLKSEDMLYVSRAIKQSPWLFTDKEHSNIINPQYLNDALFPQMITKAACKFLLHVRLNLKEESRVEEFFKYYEVKDVKVALKWLPNCSLTFIEKAVEKYCNELELDLFKRLCERSFSVLEIYHKKSCRGYSKIEFTKAVIFLINTNTERYLDIYEESRTNYGCFRFGPKQTEKIMKKNPQRILDNFEKYKNCVDLSTVARHLGKDNIKEFLLKQSENPKLQANWFRYENIKKFVEFMPKEGKFEFLKQLFIEKEKSGGDVAIPMIKQKLCMPMACSSRSYKVGQSSSNSKPSTIYQWYRHAPFDVAFPELKKLIRTESSPDERINMLIVMLNTAGKNNNHLQAVLQHFHDRHINEPFRFKSMFINTLLSTTETHRYDENCWKILDKIYHSMEVYIESDNNVQNCTKSVIIRKVLHDEKIPDTVEKNFTFNTFNKYVKKLNEEEKGKMFAYLYNHVELKIKAKVVTNKDDLDTVVSLLNDALQLLIDWNKELSDYPYVLDKIKELIKLKKDKTWECCNIDSLFDKKKSWKKLMFEESLIISPSEETCYNAIKHDSNLLKRYPAELDGLRYADGVSLKRTLRKIRTFWPESLAKEWSIAYRARLEIPGGHKAVVCGLCTLLPRDNLSEILKKYAPETSKIDWSEADELQLSLQKQIAMNMHIARPQPLPESVLLYAKGDYLQFSLPSLNAIFFNLSAVRSREHIKKILDAPVSIQKHGIRLAFDKLKLDEVKEILLNIWNSSKNASIRKVIFQLAHALLCKEKSPEKAEELWHMLEAFINNLTEEENKEIYITLSKVHDVPETIQGRFCMKNYKLLKSLPAKLDCGGLADTLAMYTAGIMDKIDPEFVRDLLLEYINGLFVENAILSNRGISLKKVVCSYLLCSQSDHEQEKRYDEIFAPIMKHCFDRWNEVHENSFKIRDYFKNLLKSICEELGTYHVQRNTVVPVTLFTKILTEMEKRLDIVENYVILTDCKVNAAFVQCIKNSRHTITSEECRIEEVESESCNKPTESDRFSELLLMKVMPDFARGCIELLKKDMSNYYPFIHSAFTKVLIEAIQKLNIPQKCLWVMFEALLDADFHPSYFVVTKMINHSYCCDEFKQNKKDVLMKIKSHSSLEVKMNFYNKFDGHDAETLQ